MMKKLISQALHYNHWAYQRLLKDLANIKQSDFQKTLPLKINTIEKIIQHLIYYDTKYYQRITEQTTTLTTKHFPINPSTHPLPQLASHWLNWANTVNIKTLTNHASTILKLCNHNNYHRTQITTALNFCGYHTLSLDIYLFEEQLATPNGETTHANN